MDVEAYSLEKAVEYGWSSIGTGLASYRVDTLDKYLIGNRVLDAGCGGGGYVDYLAKKGKDVTGVDAHEAILSVAGSRAFQGKFLIADLNDTLPFQDDSFTTSYCFDVLEHIDDLKALAELARVTSQRIILTVPRDDSECRRYGLRFPPYIDPTHLRYYTDKTIQDLVNSIRPRQVTILDECPTNIRAMSVHRLSAKSRYSFLTPVYHRILRFMLERSTAREFYWNYLAILDL